MPTKILFTDYENDIRSIELYNNTDNRIYIELHDENNPYPQWVTLEVEDAVRLVKHLKREIGYAKQNIEKEVDND